MVAIAIAIASGSADFPSFASRLQNILTLPLSSDDVPPSGRRTG
jgi:hypothetical protein